MWADPVVTRYISGRAFTPEEVWARLLRYAGHWSWLNYGYWAIEENSTGRFIGELGFADYKREMQPSIAGLPELGWVLATQSHGQGYATEAVHAVLAWADGHFGTTRTVCIIHPDNRASIRVAEKSGYQEWRHTTYKGNPTILYYRQRAA